MNGLLDIGDVVVLYPSGRWSCQDAGDIGIVTCRQYKTACSEWVVQLEVKQQHGFIINPCQRVVDVNETEYIGTF